MSHSVYAHVHFACAHQEHLHTHAAMIFHAAYTGAYAHCARTHARKNKHNLKKTRWMRTGQKAGTEATTHSVVQIL